MKERNVSYLSSDGMTTIQATIWEPECEPRAVLQIVHGMIEFIGRYKDFASYLTEQGYVVAGENHLGHGTSVIDDSYHGYFGENGNAKVIADIHTFRQMLEEEFEGLPFIMLGHSMGSFFTRQYITENEGENAKGLEGAIIMGTGWQPAPLLALGKAVASISSAFGREKKPSKLIELMAFGTYLKRIENPKSASDWLTRDREIVKAYRKHPHCRFHFTRNGFYTLFDTIKKSQDTSKMKNLPEGMPLLFVAGAEDPVGNYGEGVRKAFMVYKENTDCQIDIKIYEDDRHEILNELDRDQVYADILEWMDACLEDRR